MIGDDEAATSQCRHNSRHNRVMDNVNMVEAARKVTVVGLGREGLAATRLLAGEGARVLVSDSGEAGALQPQLESLQGLDVTFSLGAHHLGEALDCDLLVLSPGVDKRSPLVLEAVRRGLTITSATELFMARCTAPIVGVTGSAGKTTTTSLIGAMLREARDHAGGRPVYVGGNIGQPLLDDLPEIGPEAWVVLELSSFQLEWLRTSPHVAVVTNVTPNHLDRHGTMEEYQAAKANIVAHQTGADLAVLNKDEPNSAAMAGLTRARVLYFSLSGAGVGPGGVSAYLDGDQLLLVRDGCSVPLCRAGDLQIPGRHNIANALAAAIVAGACGVEPIAIGEAIRRFRGVPHRLQPIAAIKLVTYYDDSIATAPERTLAALAAIQGPVVLILGGRDKHLPWDRLAHVAADRCRGIVLIGEAAPLIRQHLSAALASPPGVARRLPQPGGIVDASTMAAAVEAARGIAQPGDSVVLAPGCASYDMYRDYEERGDDFAREVRRLSGHVEGH